MGTVIQLTNGPTRITTGAAMLVKDGVIDVTAFNSVDLYLRVYEASGTTPSMTMIVQTSMVSSDDDTLWVTLASFTAVTTAPTVGTKSIVSTLLRYIRWTATLTGTTPGFTFELSGVGR